MRQAERAQKRGDNATVGRSIDQLAANMGTINNAIEHGQVEQSDAISVFDRVNNNTSRHISKLEDLLGTVPEEAQAGIQRALDNSVRGRDMATQALQRSRAASIMTGRRGANRRRVGRNRVQKRRIENCWSNASKRFTLFQRNRRVKTSRVEVVG